jgi:ATP-dependent exoDNAse (exonuclease V) beta subunit
LPWHSFARGAEAGNFLHDQLEWLAGEQFALAQHEPLAARLRQHCRRAGRAAQADDVVAWLSQVVQTVLPGPEVALSGLQHVLPEMEFWLPARALLLYGAGDIALARHRIQESPAPEEQKRIERARLEAMVSIAEAATCRRRILLRCFGEDGPESCGACDVNDYKHTN